MLGEGESAFLNGRIPGRPPPESIGATLAGGEGRGEPHIVWGVRVERGDTAGIREGAAG